MLSGGRKWFGLLLIAALLGFVLVWLVVSGKITDLGLGTLVGAIVGLKGLFDWSNTANNKAALAAGKKEEEDEKARLDAMSPAAVVDAAGAGAVVDDITRRAVDALRREADRAIEDLRAAARPSDDRGGR